ncbi:hypothetical protein BHE74_00058892 [Ensete ventricosum]|nr:hypothetical protein BHE74_00058892 [Ensete ventricosum]
MGLPLLLSYVSSDCTRKSAAGSPVVGMQQSSPRFTLWQIGGLPRVRQKFAEGIRSLLGVRQKLGEGIRSLLGVRWELARMTSGVSRKKTKKLIGRSSEVAEKLVGKGTTFAKILAGKPPMSDGCTIATQVFGRLTCTGWAVEPPVLRNLGTSGC